ncbi:MAG: hypothetical protein KGS49_17880, partial [Planctomycetes bacterium]|nr:hypothetical protein [Planctomycetota bacterium]
MMSEFEDRLKKAIARGASKAESLLSEEQRKRQEAEDHKRLHAKYRLELTERIESVVKKLIDMFPGFRYHSVFGESGWGSACTRDDLVIERGVRSNKYSRFELVVKPINEFFVLDLQAKGTIADRELLTRALYQPLGQVDIERFYKAVDDWAIAYAELF